MNHPRILVATAAALALFGSLAMMVDSASAASTCTPGKTKKIAFMLKQQTAFRYLNADIPFFKKTAEADCLQAAQKPPSRIDLIPALSDSLLASRGVRASYVLL
jgi:hypothetical protein